MSGKAQDEPVTARGSRTQGSAQTMKGTHLRTPELVGGSLLVQIWDNWSVKIGMVMACNPLNNTGNRESTRIQMNCE